MPERMTCITQKVRPWLVAVVILLGCLALIAFVDLFGTDSHASDKFVEASVQTSFLSLALTRYQEQYGRFPAGDQASVIKALTRGNPEKIKFIELPPRDLNKKGEYIDPWGTPYKIIPIPTQDDPNRLGVYSFGQNKKDDQGAEGSDDIVSWR